MGKPAPVNCPNEIESGKLSDYRDYYSNLILYKQYEQALTERSKRRNEFYQVLLELFGTIIGQEPFPATAALIAVQKIQISKKIDDIRSCQTKLTNLKAYIEAHGDKEVTIEEAARVYNGLEV